MLSKARPGVDLAAEDVRHELFHVGTGGGNAAGKGEVAQDSGKPKGTSGYCGAPTRLMVPPSRTTPALWTSASFRPTQFQHPLGAGPAGQFPDRVDAVLAAAGDDVGGAELAAQVGALGVAAHQDDALGAEQPGGDDRAQPDRAVAGELVTHLAGVVGQRR